MDIQDNIEGITVHERRWIPAYWSITESKGVGVGSGLKFAFDLSRSYRRLQVEFFISRFFVMLVRINTRLFVPVSMY